MKGELEVSFKMCDDELQSTEKLYSFLFMTKSIHLVGAGGVRELGMPNILKPAV